MIVNQIAVFIENKKGRLHELTSALGKAGIDVVALTIADTYDYGIVRLITRDNDRAVNVLKDAGFAATRADLFGIEVDDKPNGLAGALKVLEDGEIDIEYLYSFARNKEGKAIIIFKAADTDKAMAVLKNSDVKMVTSLE